MGGRRAAGALLQRAQRGAAARGDAKRVQKLKRRLGGLQQRVARGPRRLRRRASVVRRGKVENEAGHGSSLGGEGHV